MALLDQMHAVIFFGLVPSRWAMLFGKSYVLGSDECLTKHDARRGRRTSLPPTRAVNRKFGRNERQNPQIPRLEARITSRQLIDTMTMYIKLRRSTVHKSIQIRDLVTISGKPTTIRIRCGVSSKIVDGPRPDPESSSPPQYNSPCVREDVLGRLLLQKKAMESDPLEDR